MSTTTDFTPNGTKIEGTYENDRNNEGAETFKAVIREVYNVTDVICGHHLIYEYREQRADGFVYDVVQEIPSADALIFDTDVAAKIFGDDWKRILPILAVTPVGERDKLYAEFVKNRDACKAAKAAASGNLNRVGA